MAVAQAENPEDRLVLGLDRPLRHRLGLGSMTGREEKDFLRAGRMMVYDIGRYLILVWLTPIGIRALK